MENNLNEQKQIASQIKTLRASGNLYFAVFVCKKAIEQYPDENFFYKILGDLQYDCGMEKDSFDSYIEFVIRIREKTYLTANLFRFIRKLRKNGTGQIDDKIICQKLIAILDNHLIVMETRIKLIDFIADTFSFSDPFFTQYVSVLGNCKKSSEIKRFMENTGKEELYLFFFIIGKQLALPKFRICDNTFKILVSSMEKNRFYTIALKLTRIMLKSTRDGVVVRTLFRLCRLIGDYSFADEYLTSHPYIFEQGDFNIQYELVYYFKEKKDGERLVQSLNKIKDSAQGNLAISKTLYNFYMQFEMLSKAEEMIVHMEKLHQEKFGTNRRITKGEDTAAETDEGVWYMLRNMVSEKEHNRQLIATKDLIKGFAHELGQPLTNIRYNIGFYFMKKERGKEKPEDVDEVLNNVMRQVARIDKLMKRFSPIFSGKNENVHFCVMEEMKTVFDELAARLKINRIAFTVEGDECAELYGEPLTFHQIFYNLIINSVHSIGESTENGRIECSVRKKSCKVEVIFSDNGRGIPAELVNKIFEPFFSTKHKKKDYTMDEGGEGLGLYIVWHIVKMFNGTIHVDKAYKNGARFILEFIAEKEDEDV